MKRIAIFVLLGPLITFIILVAVMLLFARVGSGVGDLLYLGYVFGTVPALLSALVDWFFAKWLMPLWRAIATGVISALGLCIALAMIDKSVAIFGIIGFVSAAVCSWLSGRAAYP